MVEIALDGLRVKKMKPYQLKEAVRWEAEPYMSAPAAESLVGFEVGLRDSDGMTVIWVSTIPEEDYKELKRAFDDRGLNLKRVYPPDVCFSVGAMFGTQEKNLAVLNIGSDSTGFTVLEDGKAIGFRLLPLSAASARSHLDGLPAAEMEASLQEVLSVPPAYGSKLVMTGAGALDRDIVAFFREEADADVSVLQLTQEDALPDFAGAVGAALRELYLPGRFRTIGINDRVELERILRERVHIFPIALIAVLTTFFLLHFLFLKYQMSGTEASLVILRQDHAALRATADRYAELKSEEENLQLRREELAVQAAFLAEDAPGRIRELHTFLASLYIHSPPDIILTEVSPSGEGWWRVLGTSRSTASVSSLALNLQREGWCSHVRINQVNFRDRGTAHYTFELEVVFADE
jgi:Tfp pilus assembly protein PilN